MSDHSISAQSSLLASINDIGLPVLVLAEDFTILEFNNLFLQLFRPAGGLVVGSSFGELGCSLFKEDGNSLSLQSFNEILLALSCSPGTAKTLGLRLEGSEEISWFTVTAITHSGINGAVGRIVVSFTDVTELVGEKVTQKQINLAKKEWEITVDALQDIVTIQNRKMEIVRANRVAHELLGFKLGELKGKKCFQVFHDLQVPCAGCPVERTAQDSCPHTGTIYNRKVNKTFSVSSFPVFNQIGEMYQLVHVARDVTQYLKNEFEKNRLMAAIEQASESVVITSVAADIQYVNPAFEEITGYCKEDVIGKNLNILKSGVHDEAFYTAMWETLLSKKVWRGKLTNRRKNGALYKEDATISPVLGSAGNIVNFVALKRDITREEQLEHQLHQAIKMEALGTLAGGIAHDFNNILAAMIGYAELAKNRLNDEHPVKKDLEQVLVAGDRAVDLVNQILTFSRREIHGQFQLLKLQNTVREIIKLLGPSLPPTINFIHDIDDSCRSVYADPGQLYQVVMNLCTNARQAIGEAHGTIAIKLHEIETTAGAGKDSEIGVNGAYLALEVRDTGCGIDEEKLERIYDPFFTTKQKEHGTGLGLAVVHGIIKKHKGEIHVESTPGQGTTFHVYLAIDGRGLVGEREQVKDRNGGNERILIVDDEPFVADVLCRSLEKVGYRVTTYNDSIEAVKQYRENPYCCDLVITDMLMPNMTGAELAREFLSIRNDLPIIMLTGHSEHFNRERALLMGIKEYLFKPVKTEKLRETISALLQKASHK